MKTARDSTDHLTESNLERHKQLLQRQELKTRTTSWAEKVIKDEQIHQFYSQTHLRALGRRCSQDAIRDTHLAATDVSRTDTSIGSLKLFEPQQGICLEDPLERFLTPGGCDGPYSRVALREMGYSFGSMDGREERKQLAQQRAEAVVKRKAKERAVDGRRS